MTFVFGFALWIVFAVAAGFLVQRKYPAGGTIALLTFAFALFGAVIGGMLGTFPYIFNDPAPLRVGGMIGGLVGALFFPFLYHFMARKAV